MCRKLFKIYRNCNGLRLTEIVTGDETRIHYYESPRKTDIAKRCDSTKKLLYTIFFNKEDPVVKVAIPKDRSITGHVYRYHVLYKVKTL